MRMEKILNEYSHIILAILALVMVCLPFSWANFGGSILTYIVTVNLYRYCMEGNIAIKKDKYVLVVIAILLILFSVCNVGIEVNELF